MKIRYNRHRDKSHLQLPGSFLLVGIAFVRGTHHASGVFVHAKLPEVEARRQIKEALLHYRDGTKPPSTPALLASTTKPA